MIEVTVLVPEDRVASFYEMVGRWLGGEANGRGSGDIIASELVPWSNSGDDVALARRVWVKLSPPARGMFELLMSAPGEWFPADELADRLDIPNGMYGVAGVMAWPGRYSYAVGRLHPVHYEPGPVGAGARYRMEPEVAALFRRATEPTPDNPSP